MRFTTVSRGGVTDNRGIEGFVLDGEGDFAIRVGESDIIISYRNQEVLVRAYSIGDLTYIWDSFEYTDLEIMGWALGGDKSDDDGYYFSEPSIHDEPPQDYGPPGSGAVIIEYD
jgi:hypothetical protein